jgi:transcriptional regulator with XRE-family HTH domain
MNSNRKQFATLGGKLNVTGNNINYYRVQKGLSVQQLSDKLIMLGLDIHRQAIFAIEAGKRSLTDYELCVIAEILGVTSNDLLKDFRERIKNELK